MRLRLERNGESINFQDARRIEENRASKRRRKNSGREKKKTHERGEKVFKGKSWPVRLAVFALIEGAFPLR